MYSVYHYATCHGSGSDQVCSEGCCRSGNGKVSSSGSIWRRLLEAVEGAGRSWDDKEKEKESCTATAATVILTCKRPKEKQREGNRATGTGNSNACLQDPAAARTFVERVLEVPCQLPLVQDSGVHGPQLGNLEMQ